MIDAVYDPRYLINVMEILKATTDPNRIPEFQSTYPGPENRIEKLKLLLKNITNKNFLNRKTH